MHQRYDGALADNRAVVEVVDIVIGILLVLLGVFMTIAFALIMVSEDD